MRIQKSRNPTLRHSYAKRYYNERKYSRVAELMVDVLPHYEGTQEGVQTPYTIADALLQSKQKSNAAEYFRRLYSRYPQNVRAAEARYKIGLALYRITPDSRLGQPTTYSALKELQGFLEAYPQSEHRREVEQMSFDLQDNLAKRELITADLYYNFSTYIDNSYTSAIIATRSAPKAYPYTEHHEDLLFIIVEASCRQTINNVESKKQGRLREVINAYHNYENAFPNEKRLKRTKTLHNHAQRMIMS